MLSERSTATSSRMFAKFSSVTIAPSTPMMKVFSRNCGMYCRIPRRSVSFTFRYLVLKGIRKHVCASFQLLFAQTFLQRADATLVLFRRADGNAYPFWQLITRH